jgi:hypothetical protein
MTQVLLRAAAGPYVASFTAVEPPPRFAPAAGDPGAWSRLRASEAPARTGPWTLLGTVDINPVDTDPAAPAPLRVTVAGVALVAGWYLLELLDADGNSQPFAPLYNGQSWRPSVQDVADACGAYTTVAVDYDSGGEVRRLFTEDTVPSAAAVEGYITAAVNEIAGRVGLSDDRLSDLAVLARSTAAAHAAAAVEAEKAKEGATENANSVWRWQQNTYLGCLSELTQQARSGALRLV